MCSAFRNLLYAHINTVSVCTVAYFTANIQPRLRLSKGEHSYQGEEKRTFISVFYAYRDNKVRTPTPLNKMAFSECLQAHFTSC